MRVLIAAITFSVLLFPACRGEDESEIDDSEKCLPENIADNLTMLSYRLIVSGLASANAQFSGRVRCHFQDVKLPDGSFFSFDGKEVPLDDNIENAYLLSSKLDGVEPRASERTVALNLAGEVSEIKFVLPWAEPDVVPAEVPLVTGADLTWNGSKVLSSVVQSPSFKVHLEQDTGRVKILDPLHSDLKVHTAEISFTASTDPIKLLPDNDFEADEDAIMWMTVDSTIPFTAGVHRTSISTSYISNVKEFRVIAAPE